MYLSVIVYLSFERFYILCVDGWFVMFVLPYPCYFYIFEFCTHICRFGTLSAASVRFGSKQFPIVVVPFNLLSANQMLSVQ